MRPRPRDRRLSWPLLLTAATASALGCARDHGLGVESTGTSGSGGGASSTTTSSTHSSTGSSGNGGAGAGGGGSMSSGNGGAGAAEPDGPLKLTVVNGVNDYGGIRICFLPYPAGDPTATPWPAAPGGLPFAHAQTIDPATLPAGTDIRPTVLAGALLQITGMTCDEAIALAASEAGAGGGGAGGAGGGPPTPVVVAAPLAVLPAAVLSAKRSLLLAPVGCIGGPGHDGQNATLGCGFTYTPSTPTIDLVALGMSRIPDAVHVSLQVVNAAAALQPSDIRLTPGTPMAPEYTLATMLPVGGIEPKPPFAKLTLGELGAIDQAHLKTYLPGQMFMTSDTPLTEVFVNGTVKQGELQNGKSYVLLAVGAYPGVAAGSFWHKLTYTLVKADP